jgi:triosephosphate isomerase
VVSLQVREALHGLDISSPSQLVLAYEPVWAIGTGRAATGEGANTIVQNVIRPTVAGLFGDALAQGCRVLYGGSVDANNAAEFFGQPEVDGALVGGASLDADAFARITEAAAS